MPDRDERYRRALAFADAARWPEAAQALAPSLIAGGSGGDLALGAEIALALQAYAEACEFARGAAANGDAVPVDGLLRFLRVLRRLELPDALERMLALHADADLPAAAMAEIALLASSATLYGPATHWVGRLRRLAPANADGLYLAGLLDMFAGRREASLQALDAALAIEPRMANAHWLVAMQADRSTAEAHVAALRRASTGVVPGSEAQAYLQFALHRRLHALGRYDEAWAALEAGMAVARRLMPYRPDRTEALFGAIRRSALPPFRPARPEPDGAGLIFIVGMFRSGTSLIERVLTGHPDVADGGETFQFTAALREAADYEAPGVIDEYLLSLAPRLDFDAVRSRMYAYARWRAPGKAWLTEKLPSNFLDVGLIAHAFPEARIIHLQRDPVATCFSNLRTYFRGVAEYSNSVADFAHYHRLYRELMAHWHDVLPGRVLDVVYEEFVADPGAGSRRILDFCGLAFAPQVLDVSRADGHSATASSADVRTGIRTDRGREWEPYRDRLGPMLGQQPG